MYVTVAEYKKNMRYYFAVSNNEDVYITARDGEVIRRIVKPDKESVGMETDTPAPEIDEVENDASLGEIGFGIKSKNYCRTYRKIKRLERRAKTGPYSIEGRLKRIKFIYGILPEMDDETRDRIKAESIEEE